MLTVIRTEYTSLKDGTQAIKILFHSSMHYAEIGGDLVEQYLQSYATRVYSVKSEHYELNKGMYIPGEIVKISTPTLEKLDAEKAIVLIGDVDIESLDISNWIEEEEAEIPPNCIITKIIDMNFDFLDNVTLNTVEAPTKRVAVEKLPEGMAIRVMKNGAVYPSKEMVDKYRLEYTPKDSQETTFGMEIFKSTNFSLIPEGVPGFLVAGFVELPAPKVDMFASTKYEEDGTAKSSVLTQGSNTYGKQLLEVIAEVTGVTLGENDKFIDLVLDEAHQLVSATNVYYVPKPITKGDRAGQIVYPKREKLIAFPISPVMANATTTEGIDASVPETPVALPEEVAEVVPMEAPESAMVPEGVEVAAEVVVNTEVPTPMLEGAEPAPEGMFADTAEPAEVATPKTAEEMFQ